MVTCNQADISPVCNQTKQTKKKIEQLVKVRAELQQDIKHYDKKLRTKHFLEDTPPVCAFVTFDKQEAVVTAVLAYRTSLFRRFFMPSSHLLKGKKIDVRTCTDTHAMYCGLTSPSLCLAI
jgi:hypothetical protein